jgi:hypothetical protein
MKAERMSLAGAMLTLALLAAPAVASADVLPAWLVGTGTGRPVLGVAIPPGGHPWTGPMFGTETGCYFTRVRVDNAWKRAQICGYR